MSSERQRNYDGSEEQSNDKTPTPPAHPASEVPRHRRPRVIFDSDIIWTIEQMGRRRAPTPETVQNHQRGLAGEVGYGTYRGTTINWTVYEDFVGDDGYDLEDNGIQFEVKATGPYANPCLRISQEQLGSADVFVLARVAELSYVELIGYATRAEVEAFGKRSPYDDEYWVDTDHLHPLPQTDSLGPEEVREVHAGLLDR